MRRTLHLAAVIYPSDHTPLETMVRAFAYTTRPTCNSILPRRRDLDAHIELASGRSL